MKILHVEDDVRISALSKAIFMKTSHDFLICHDPVQASKLLSEYDIDLVILDLIFSDDQTGIQILEKIYSENLPTKVIVFSGFANEKFYSQLVLYRDLNIILSIYQKPGNFLQIVKEIDAYSKELV